MKLTTKGRYAVAAMADIASISSNAPLASPIALSDIALRQGISQSYLEQLLPRMRRAGLVTSSRGAGGGYELAREASEIRISEIIAAVDEQIRTTACAPGGETGCQGSSARCLTHDLWDELSRQIEIFLNAISLEDVIEKRVLGTAAVNAPARIEKHLGEFLGAAQ